MFLFSLLIPHESPYFILFAVTSEQTLTESIKKLMFVELTHCAFLVDRIFWGCWELISQQLLVIELILTKVVFDLAVYTTFLVGIHPNDFPISSLPMRSPKSCCCICLAIIRMITLATHFLTSFKDAQSNRIQMLCLGLNSMKQWTQCLNKVAEYYYL